MHDIPAWLEAHHLSHPLLALMVVAVSALLRAESYGAGLAVAFYFGREVTHAGMQWPDNPWWWGFDPTRWTADNHLDFWPVVAATALAAAAIRARRRARRRRSGPPAGGGGMA